jgi:tripeptidyl-peptidase-1
MKSSILLLGAAAAAVVAVPAPHNYELHEKREFMPSSWIEGKRLDGSTSLPVRIGLTQPNLDYGHDLLMEMYIMAPYHFICSL